MFLVLIFILVKPQANGKGREKDPAQNIYHLLTTYNYWTISQLSLKVLS